MPSRLTVTAPKRVWLHSDQRPASAFKDAWAWSERTDGSPQDVEYVRADLARAALPVNWAEDPALRKLGTALGLRN